MMGSQATVVSQQEAAMSLDGGTDPACRCRDKSLSGAQGRTDRLNSVNWLGTRSDAEGRSVADCDVLLEQLRGLLLATVLMLALPCAAQQQLGHDHADRLVRVMQPDGSLLTYGYDAAGNLLRIGRNSPPQWVTSPINGHRYALVSCGNWLQCERWAVAAGGHLATVRSAEENAWLVGTFHTEQTFSGHWIGLNDLAVKGQYLWSSGEPVTYLNWRVGEPNNNCNGVPEDYVHLWGYGAGEGQVGTWNDFPLETCSPNMPSINMGLVELDLGRGR